MKPHCQADVWKTIRANCEGRILNFQGKIVCGGGLKGAVEVQNLDLSQISEKEISISNVIFTCGAYCLLQLSWFDDAAGCSGPPGADGAQWWKTQPAATLSCQHNDKPENLSEENVNMAILLTQ